MIAHSVSSISQIVSSVSVAIRASLLKLANHLHQRNQITNTSFEIVTKWYTGPPNRPIGEIWALDVERDANLGPLGGEGKLLVYVYRDERGNFLSYSVVPHPYQD
jgi:hypothetical protein